MCICMLLYAFVNIYTFRYMYTYIYLYAYIHIYILIYKYIHTCVIHIRAYCALFTFEDSPALLEGFDLEELVAEGLHFLRCARPLLLEKLSLLCQYRFLGLLRLLQLRSCVMEVPLQLTDARTLGAQVTLHVLVDIGLVRLSLCALDLELSHFLPQRLIALFEVLNFECLHVGMIDRWQWRCCHLFLLLLWHNTRLPSPAAEVYTTKTVAELDCWSAQTSHGLTRVQTPFCSRLIDPSRPTQSIMYVPLQVNRFAESILLIVQYRYLKSFSGNFYCQEFDPPHKIMNYCFY